MLHSLPFSEYSNGLEIVSQVSGLRCDLSNYRNNVDEYIQTTRYGWLGLGLYVDR